MTKAHSKTFDGQLADYSDEFLTCRGRRNHPWQLHTDFNVTTNRSGRIIEFKRVMHCALCTADRIDTFEVTKSGRFRRKGNPQYRYAEGYQLHRGNRIKLEAARDELLMRELRRDLSAELLARLEGMRPAARKEVKPVKLRVVGVA